MTTYGYARVSTQEQADGTSLAEQQRRINGIAVFRGEMGAETFVDAGVSGSVPLADRLRGGEMLANLCNGDTIIVSKLDRMFRDAADALATLNYFRSIEVKLILCDIGTEPVTENGVSKLFFTILAGFAEWERDRIRERQAEGIKAKSANGGFNGGRPPFGYMVEGKGRAAVLKADPAHAAALAELRKCFDEKRTLRATSNHLSEHCGTRLSFQAVKRVFDRFDDERTLT